MTDNGRRAFHYRALRSEGFDALSAWNGARAKMRFSDAIRADAINQFIADCAADDVACTKEQAAEILEERDLMSAAATRS